MQDYYEDAPIPPRPHQASPQAETLPRQLERLAALISSSRFASFGRAASFYAQAKLMEDYRDDREWKENVVSYYPTYQSFSMAQLRGYFGWRTRWRQGRKTWAPLSFIFMHVYELLMCVGARGPQDAMAKLEALCQAYGSQAPALVYYLNLWMPDMVIYYGLPLENWPDFENMRQQDAAFAVLAQGQAQDEKLYEAITALSSYRLDRSAFCRHHPDRARRCICRTWRALDTYYRRRWKKSACQRLVGVVQTWPVPLFYNAVFYDRLRIEDRTVTVDPVRHWTCNGGHWTLTAPSLAIGQRSHDLGGLMQECDRLMREIFAEGKPLKQKLNKPGLSAVIRRAVEEEAQAEQEAARARVDLSQLDEIRTQANQTQEMLLAGRPEEADVSPQTQTTMPETPPELPQQEPAPPAPFADGKDPLTALERAFLQALLCGDDAQALARRHKIFPAVLADGINEKLFDRFDDTVLETVDDHIQVIEDYEADLKETYLQ